MHLFASVRNIDREAWNCGQTTPCLQQPWLLDFGSWPSKCNTSNSPLQNVVVSVQLLPLPLITLFFTTKPCRVIVMCPWIRWYKREAAAAQIIKKPVSQDATASNPTCTCQRDRLCFATVSRYTLQNRSSKTNHTGLEDAGSGAWWSCGSGRATVSFTDYRATGIKNLSARVQQLVPKHAHARATKEFRDGQ